jgi:putative oxidoreductase
MSRNGKSDTDIPALVIRLALGPMLIAHGANKAFGKGGFEGTTKWFDALGLKPGWLHARLASATEMGAGALITVGFLNPLPSAAVIGLMTVAAATDHKGKGFFVFKGGWEYVGVISAAATALAAMGNGRWSLDALTGRNRKGAKWGLASAAMGASAAAALLKTAYQPSESS